MALAFATIASLARAQSLPHNIPDFSQDSSRATVRSTGNGSWSSPSTWQSGVVPTANHVVHVDPGHVVTIDTQDATAYTIAVHGTLRFEPAVDTRLRVTNLMIMGDHGMASMTSVGRVEIGTAAAPVAADRVAEIVIANTPLGGGVADPEQFGTGILNFGKLTIHGSVRRPTFTRVAVEPRAGHTSLTLTEPATGWRPGDRLVLPDTRHMKESETTGSGWINAQNQWEEFNVQSVSADGRTITLSRALTFDHLGARDLNGVLDFLPHVGNLSRNVTLRSESATGTRGHFVSVHSADTDIRYARFLDLGRTTFKPLNTTTNAVGRYPIHMHHNRGPAATPANGYQFTLIGNAVDGGSAATQFKWGIAIHNSHYGLIQDNVVYNYNGSSIATEDGSESFNLFDHNFALRGLGEPNNAVSEARSAMGTEGVGFWFRGPNNYVRNNVAANFQNSTTEAAYGFVYQFIRLGNISTPNFKGADPAVTGQFTSRNGNNMPILEFDNNEVYGATQGGFTYWWVSSQDPQPYANAQESLIKNLKIWHIYNKAVYHYPSQKITFDGLTIRGKFDANARCCGNGIYGADYSTKAVIVRNSDIQGMEEGIQFPEAGFGPEPNLTVDNTFLRNHSNIQVPTNGSVNGCWMQDKLVVIRNSRFEAPPGRALNDIAMVRDVGYAPECLAILNEARVYAYNGVATDNFQIYHTNTSVLPRPPASCSPTTRPGINGLLCTIAAEGPAGPTPAAPTASFTANPTAITSGSSTSLTWSTTNATSVSINPGVGGVNTSGSISVAPVTTTTYVLTATGAGGSVTAAATVTVSTPPPASPTVTLSASPTSIAAGASATLSWASTNATSVSIDQGVGTVAASGSRAVAPSATTTYTVTAQGASSSATAVATVTVTQPPPPLPLPTATITAAPGTIAAGESTTLSWSSSAAATISIAPGIGVVGASGSRTVSPSTATTYVLSASNSTGTVTASTSVLVTPPPQGNAFATVGLTAGWASFGQVIPKGVASQGVSVGGLLTQTDVKNRWPDGSIRFAIISVKAPSDGPLPLHAANVATGTFTPAPVASTVSLSIAGVTYTATLPVAASADAWLAGPVVHEDRQVVVPVTSGGAAHPFLRVNFDRRRYQDGEARIDVSVENMLDTNGATTVTYDVVINVNGAAVYTRDNVQHYYLTRWRKVFNTAAFDASSITPDLAPYYEARALPPYLPLVSNVVSSPTGASFDILQPGALIANMPGHGGRPELAPYPDWTARYLVHRDLTQRSFVLANGDLSGSWPIHVRETGSRPGIGTERYVSLDQRPTVWLDGRAQSSGADYIHGLPLPIREYTSTTPGAGQSPLIPDNAHQPSLAYVPYLLTGDRYYAEEMAFWANYAMLRTYNGDGVRSSAGILQSNEVRGYGWALRNLVDAAAYYPDSSPMRAYLAAKVGNNLAWLDAYANSQDPITNPFTVLWLDKRPEGPQYRGLWEENYLAYAIDRAFQQGFSGGLAHRDAIAKFQLLLFSSEPDYPRSAAAPNVVGVGVPSSSGFIFHRSMSEIWNATQGQTRPFTGYYGPEARLNLMIGVEQGWFGAQDSYDYLWPFLAVQPAWGTLPDLAQRAGWALDYYPGSAPPPPAPTPVAAALQSPVPGSTFTSTSALFSWNAGTGVTAYQLTVGSTVGGADIYAGPSTNSLSVTVTGLPSDGRAISARLSSLIDGVWRSQDYAFTAMTPPPPVAAATLLSPTPGTTLASTSQTFTWSQGSGVTSYRLSIGTTSGGTNLYAGTATTNVSATVTGLPSNGGAVWVQLSSLIGGTWQSTNYNFTAFSSSAGLAVRQTVSVNGNGTVTAPPVSTSIAGELLVAFAASSGPGNLKQQLTIQGGGLTWRRAIRSNAQAGASEIWWARATTPVSNVRVTSTQARAGFAQSLTVLTVAGASGIGNVVEANAMGEAPRIVLTTTRSGSMVFAVGNDWDGAVARRIPTSQVMVHEWLNTTINDTMWVQTLGQKVTSSGTTVTLSASEPTANRWNLAAIEIRRQ